MPYPVTVSFGAADAGSSSAHEVRQAIQELAQRRGLHTQERGDLLDLRFIRTAKKNWRSFAMADSSGRELTYGRGLTGSLLVADWLRKNRPS